MSWADDSERAAGPDAGARPVAGQRRVVIDWIGPRVPGAGDHPIKRVLGDRVTVEADLLADGHDKIAGVVRYRKCGTAGPIGEEWREAPLEPVENDRFRATFVVDAIGRWEYTVRAWVDSWASFVWALRRKLEAKQGIELDLQDGALLAAAAAERATGQDRKALEEVAARLRDRGDPVRRVEDALRADVASLMRAHPDLTTATTHDPPLEITVDPLVARFGTWYELFPRSTGPSGSHGTFKDAAAVLPYIAEMGFDVVYLPPIHPIGKTHRKGIDNRLNASAGDPGSPWAIGSAEGGHRDIHPELGTAEDFRRFVRAAREHRLDVALDIALQASPDHPWVAEHPEWFVHRADGSIQFAENPPKKYQDIVPFDFAGKSWESLWLALRDIFFHWIGEGIHVFRVDNPHTKSLRFWEWCIRTIKARHPDVIFLAEAFTRPKLMYALAKIGFSQSYTYFTWRTTKTEIIEYVRSLTTGDLPEFFRPNFWPNTPDILPEHLQYGTRATFIARAALAATLSPSYGIYGPAFELGERAAREGAEEYASNEKYQLRTWDLSRADSLRPVLRRLNEIRRDNVALQRVEGTFFHPTDNDQLLAYSRTSEDLSNALLCVVNLDPHHRHQGWISLDLKRLGVAEGSSFQVHDLLSDARFLWREPRAFVSLDPATMPVQVFRVRRRVRSEHNFEYYL